MTSKEQQIADMLEGTVSALGFELWGVEYLAQGRHSIVRIYIDSPRGVSVDDCAPVRRCYVRSCLADLDAEHIS